MAPFAGRLSETASTWGHAVAPITEWVACAFWQTIRRPDVPLATRLTQSKRREVKGRAIPANVSTPRPENVCSVCGKIVANGSTRRANCALELARGKMKEVAQQGRVASKSPESRARLAATQRRQASARWNWDSTSQPE
jgi:ribosomal protein S14